MEEKTITLKMPVDLYIKFKEFQLKEFKEKNVNVTFKYYLLDLFRISLERDIKHY